VRGGEREGEREKETHTLTKRERERWIFSWMYIQGGK